MHIASSFVLDLKRSCFIGVCLLKNQGLTLTSILFALCTKCIKYFHVCQDKSPDLRAEKNFQITVFVKTSIIQGWWILDLFLMGAGKINITKNMILIPLFKYCSFKLKLHPISTCKHQCRVIDRQPLVCYLSIN